MILIGIITKEALDLSGEICSYNDIKNSYRKWTDACAAATGGRYFGLLCAGHRHALVGRAIQPPAFDDELKEVRMVFEITDGDCSRMVLNRKYGGFSQSCNSVERWSRNGETYYTGEITEVSLVQHPVLPNARFEILPPVRRVTVRPQAAALCPICRTQMAGYAEVFKCYACGQVFPKSKIRLMGAA
jgi:hypothetical protein